MKTRLLSVLAIVALAVAVAPSVQAQRSLALHPTTSLIQQPNKFLSANSFALALPAKAAINAKTAATSNFTALQALPSTVKFYVTQIKVETTAATAITGGAILTFGSTGTTASSLLGSTTLANTPAVGGFETFAPKAGALPLAAADVPTVTVGTAATGTSQTLKATLIGYWQ